MPQSLHLRPRQPLKGAFAVIALLVGMCHVPVAAGATIFFSLERDTPSLSPACQARLKGTPAEYKYWEKQVGGADIFIHYHHYCFGVFEMKKAMTTVSLDRGDQMALYRDAATQFDYVLKRWPKDHPLYIESATYMNMVNMRLGRTK